MYKFLLATDGSENSLRAAKQLVDIYKIHDEAEIYIITAYEGMFIGGEAALTGIDRKEILGYARQAAQEVMDKTTAVFKEAGIEVKEIIVEGDPGPTIVETARSLGVNQIVIGTRGMGKVKELFMGSVSRKVVHLSPYPVLLVK